MSNEELITNRLQILDCLNEIHKKGSPVFLSVCSTDNTSEDPTLNCSVTDQVFESRIQSIQNKQNFIILQQVLPGTWRETISADTLLEVRSCMTLGNVRFMAYLSPLEDSDNDPYCKLTLPDKIYRMQLRDYFRVSLVNTKTTAILKLDDDSEITGTCKDFSVAGAQFILPASTAQNLAVGQTVDQCTMTISDLLDIRCCGKICSLQRTEKEILAGIQFIDLSPLQTRPISMAISKIERQNINT